MKKVITVSVWISGTVTLLFLMAWCQASVSSIGIPDFELTSLDLESNVVDSIKRSKGGYSNFIRIGFRSLDDAELDFDQFKTNELDEPYGIQMKISLKNGQFITSEFELQGIQLVNDLIISGSDLHKRWHSTEEREALINLSRATVKAVYIRIYQDGQGSAMFSLDDVQEDVKRFTSFGIISQEEADDYHYAPRN